MWSCQKQWLLSQECSFSPCENYQSLVKLEGPHFDMHKSELYSEVTKDFVHALHA